MKKRILGLLLSLCMAACLLPVNAMAGTVSASVTVAGKTLKITAYDTPAYSVNTNTKLLDTEGNQFTAITQALTADSKKWNAKLVWKAGDSLPTLYLKNFIVDEYNEQAAKWKDSSTTAIAIPAGQPTKIVITGENSQIKTRFGITYKSNLEIKSNGDAKLNMRNISSAISSGTATGCALTLDANLDLFVESYYDANSHILQTNKADLTINGGNIKIHTDDEKSLFGIVARNSGNIIINGGTLNITSSIGAAPSNGSIHCSGKIIINDGTVNATAKSAVPLYAKKGIEINGGLVDIFSPYYGINAGTPDSPADIAINGGTVKISAQRAFYTYPSLGEGVFAYAGSSAENANIYDGTVTALAKEPWMLISNDPGEQIEATPTEAPTTAPTTVPTEASTAAPTVAPTTAPTTVPTEASTAAPTAAPTEAPTEASTETFGKYIAYVLSIPRLLLWVAAAGTVGFAGAVIALLAITGKKS